MSRRIIKTLTFLFAFALLGGCGQKGALYLPGEKQAALVSDVYVG